MDTTVRGPSGVLVFRSELLPFSETFVRAQATSLSRYRATFVGDRLLPDADLAGLNAIVPASRGRVSAGIRRRLGLVYGRSELVRIDRAEASLIHAHFGPDGLAALPLSRQTGLPLLVTFHGYDATRDANSDPAVARYHRQLPQLWSGMTRGIAVSDYIRDRVVALGAAPEAVRTHYIGVDTERFQPGGEREPGLVVAVGRFVEKKGFANLIRAFAREPQEPGRRLVIIGDGPLRSALEREAASVCGAIEFTGARSPQEVLGWLRRAEVLCAPSVTSSDGDTEGLPTIVVEAMACGTPVVATFHAGTPEAVVHGQTGSLVEEHDVEGLASALHDLLRDGRQRDRFSGASRIRAVERFDLRKQTQELESHYDEVAEAARHS